MNTNYVLIDFENVQPKHLDRLKGFKVLVFLGPQQKNVPLAIVSALQGFGGDVEYIELEKSGKNALDFSIAYHLGARSSKDAGAHFHIISKDTGFDPLIHHLKGKVAVKRYAAVADLGAIRHSQAPTEKTQIERIVTQLVRLKAAKPSTLKTLSSTIRAYFKNELTDQELDDLLGALKKSGQIKVDGKKVTYNLRENA